MVMGKQLLFPHLVPKGLRGSSKFPDGPRKHLVQGRVTFYLDYCQGVTSHPTPTWLHPINTDATCWCRRPAPVTSLTQIIGEAFTQTNTPARV